MSHRKPLRRAGLGAATLLLPLLLVPSSRAAGFPVRGIGKPFFIADAVVLPTGPDSVQVDFLWEVPYRELVFRKEDDWYRARYDLTIVFARNDVQVAGEVWERRVRVKSFSETRDSGRLAKGRKTLDLPSGKYEVRVTVTDRGSHSSAEARAGLDAVFGETRIGLSDLRFVRYTDEGPVVNPGRDVPVGEPGHFVRLTLHPEGSAGGTFQVAWYYESNSRERIATRDTSVVLAGEPFVLEFPIPSERFAPGVYHLDVRLEGTDRNRQERRRATLYARLTSTWFKSHRRDALEAFRIFATPEEYEVLARAPAEEWPARVDEFWEGRDPTPGTPTNEFRDEMQARMEAAATLFDEPFRRPGWKTDRGRILLQYGRPDRRTLREADFDGPARELWEYDSPRRVFLFVDDRGSGEFWLRP